MLRQRHLGVLLSLVLFLLNVSEGCNPACNFSRCRNGQAFKPRLIRDQSSPFLLRAHEKLWLPYICRRLTTHPLRIRFIKTGQALVKPFGSKKKFVKISDYSPKGMKKKLPKRYFHLKKFRRGEWVIVREKANKKQEKFLDNLCVTIPVKRYRYQNRFGKARGGWKKGGKGDCISFRTRTVKLLVELRWDSKDDLDLSVEEPDGKIASRFDNDACGSLNADVGSILGVCANVPDKSESIRYFNCVPKGRYIVRVGHFRNCGRGTRYQVRVTKFGKLVYSKIAKSNERSGSLIEELAFEV